MRYIVPYFLLFVAGAFAAEAPPIKCEDARDQWQARYEIAQQRVNQLEGNLAFISVEMKRLQVELDKLKKPVKK